MLFAYSNNSASQSKWYQINLNYSSIMNSKECIRLSSWYDFLYYSVTFLDDWGKLWNNFQYNWFSGWCLKGGMSHTCGILGVLTASYHFQPKSKRNWTKSQLLFQCNFTEVSMGEVLITKFMHSFIAQQWLLSPYYVKVQSKS